MFLSQIKEEFFKISWMQKKDLITSSIIVVVSLVVLSILFLAIDFSIHKIIFFLIKV